MSWCKPYRVTHVGRHFDPLRQKLIELKVGLFLRIVYARIPSVTAKLAIYGKAVQKHSVWSLFNQKDISGIHLDPTARVQTNSRRCAKVMEHLRIGWCSKDLSNKSVNDCETSAELSIGLNDCDRCVAIQFCFENPIWRIEGLLHLTLAEKRL
jgi:hypothetical protein